MTAIENDQLSREKVKAFQLRQRDHGWGYVFASFLPFVGLYYAITRRTITPFLYSFIGSIFIGLVVGSVVTTSNPDVTEEELEGVGSFAALVAGPFLIKKGIDQAREYAKRRLERHALPLEYFGDVVTGESSGRVDPN